MYDVGIPPASDKELGDFVLRELRKINQAINNSSPFLQLAISYKPPQKPREGQIYFADGTSWNPGSGKGYYGYKGGAWALLG